LNGEILILRGVEVHLGLLFGVILIFISIVTKVVVKQVDKVLSFSPQALATLNQITNLAFVFGLILLIIDVFKRDDE